MNKQVELHSANEMFDNWIHEFDEHNGWSKNPYQGIVDELIDLKKKMNAQLTINFINTGTSKHRKIIKMISSQELEDFMQQSRNEYENRQLYRMCDVCNTLLGDILTLNADKLVCFGFDGERFWLLKKEPAHERDAMRYYYSLSSEADYDDMEEVATSIQYLMTDDDIKAAIDADMDGFLTKKQQQIQIKSSIVSIDDFLDWAI